MKPRISVKTNKSNTYNIKLYKDRTIMSAADINIVRRNSKKNIYKTRKLIKVDGCHTYFLHNIYSLRSKCP
jgi:hypothetical protein